MQRIAHAIHDGGWRYAVREIGITTIGILIALLANAWWQNSQDRKTELIALREMRTALVLDTADLNTDLSAYRRLDSSARFLQQHALSGSAYEPAMDTLVGALYTTRTHLSHTAAYESITSMGVGLIGEDSLRLRILEFYALQNKEVAMWNDIDNRLRDDGFVPFLRKRVTLYRKSPSSPRAATPLDYPSMTRDPEYRALLYQRIETSAAAIPSYEQSVASAGRLILLLDHRIRQLE